MPQFFNLILMYFQMPKQQAQKKVLQLQKKIFIENKKMERVPEIRLFGTSQSWKHDPHICDKQYTQTSSSSFKKCLPQQFVNYSQPTFQRSPPPHNSLYYISALKTNKPSDCNYYENAIRICQQNQVLNKIKGHDLGTLTVSYLAINHKHYKTKRSCTLCQAQAITENLHLYKKQKADIQQYSNQQQQQITINFSTQKQNLPVFNVNGTRVNPVQSYQRAQNQNAKYSKDDEKSQLNWSNSMLLQETPVQMHKTSSKVVYFQEITNALTQNQQNHNDRSDFNQETGEFCAKIKDQSKFILRSSCESLVKKQDFRLQTCKQNQSIPTEKSQTPKENQVIPTKNSQNSQQYRQQSVEKTIDPIFPSKNRFPRNHFLPQIQQLLLQLRDFGDDASDTSYMLKELEEMTENHLRNKRKCIETLNAILDRQDSTFQTTQTQKKLHF